MELRCEQPAILLGDFGGGGKRERHVLLIEVRVLHTSLPTARSRRILGAMIRSPHLIELVVCRHVKVPVTWSSVRLVGEDKARVSTTEVEEDDF